MKRIALLLPFLLLTACQSGDVRDTLGLDRSAPDEFKVVSRPPLSVPPDFRLDPPDPGAPPRSSPSTESQARSLILTDESGEDRGGLTELSLGDYAVDTAVDPVVAGELSSAAESSFLSRAGADKADPNIRKKIIEDAKVEPVAEQEVSPLEEWLGMEPSDPVVDAKEEAKRIRKHKDEGKPVSGKVKTVDPQKGSVLDRLF